MLFCSCDRSRVKLKFYEKLWGGGGGYFFFFLMGWEGRGGGYICFMVK